MCTGYIYLTVNVCHHRSLPKSMKLPSWISMGSSVEQKEKWLLATGPQTLKVQTFSTGYRPSHGISLGKQNFKYLQSTNGGGYVRKISITKSHSYNSCSMPPGGKLWQIPLKRTHAIHFRINSSVHMKYRNKQQYLNMTWETGSSSSELEWIWGVRINEKVASCCTFQNNIKTIWTARACMFHHTLAPP